jgi:hypothetical protein
MLFQNPRGEGTPGDFSCSKSGLVAADRLEALFIALLARLAPSVFLIQPAA